MTVDSYTATNLWDESLVTVASTQIRIWVYVLFVFIFWDPNFEKWRNFKVQFVAKNLKLF